MARILKTRGEATVPLATLKQAWAKEEGRFFLLRPKLDGLARDLHCEYKLDWESGMTTFFRCKAETHKTD